MGIGNAQAATGKVTAFGLVRNRFGQPKIDDIKNIPEPIWDMLTPSEQQEIANARTLDPEKKSWP